MSAAEEALGTLTGTLHNLEANAQKQRAIIARQTNEIKRAKNVAQEIMTHMVMTYGWMPEFKILEEGRLFFNLTAQEQLEMILKLLIAITDGRSLTPPESVLTQEQILEGVGML